MKKRISATTGAMILIAVALALSAFAQQPAPEPKDRECTVPIYIGKDLDQKPRILAKPEPNFTSDELRTYRGRVISLEAILCGSGKVTDVKVKQSSLTDRLNDKVIEAARLIKFTPAEKDGNKVSRFVVLHYIVG